MLSENKGAFLSLVRLGIGHRADVLPEFVDWNALEDLAARQGLSAVVVDGVGRLPEDKRPPKPVLLQWIGETLQGYEYRYGQYCKAIAEMASFYNKHGYRMMVLKGYACSLDWPRPEHRPCGDIDIWLFGEYKKADAVLEKEKGKYELEALIHNLIFPMGLTNREVSYQYHNLWLLDERFATFQFIASDKTLTSFSKVKSNLEPDLVLIDKEKNLINNPISFGCDDAGEVESMVVFEFKRPGQTAHQKNKGDKIWEFSELVEKYFNTFLFGTTKKNYRGNPIVIHETTPKFGYVILDVIDKDLARYNELQGWKKTPFGSYYRIKPELNMHIEAITFQNLLKNVEKRMNPFFHQLFGDDVKYMNKKNI